MNRAAFTRAVAATATLSMIARSAQAQTTGTQTDVEDLRFGFAPLPATAPGYDPAADARALMAPGLASPATAPIPGRQYVGSYAEGERYVVRVPKRWNGSLVVCGTPALRSEFASDAIWGDYLLARGYAYAASNKGVPYNVVAESLDAAAATPKSVYPIPFDLAGLASKQMAYRFGALFPTHVSVDRWNDDFNALVGFARELLHERHGALPRRTFAVGLSNGGAQVRTLLERFPDVIDGGIDWSGVYWAPQWSLLDYLPRFLAGMPAYIRSNYRDHGAQREMVAAGFPADLRQDDLAHPSLWLEYYSNQPSFYNDLTLCAYALLIDPHARDEYMPQPFSPDPVDPVHLPGVSRSTGLASPARRAQYVPSGNARSAIERFAHSGVLERPLISIAGTHDVLIPAENNARPYAAAVRRNGRSRLHELYLVEGGTHVDTFVPFGYDVQPLAPFAWRAFDRLVALVETKRPLDASTHTIRRPSEIAL